jgi:hypothetical protein
MEIIRLDAVVADWGVLGQVKITQLLCIVTSVITLILIILIQKGIIKTEYKSKQTITEPKEINCDNIKTETEEKKD